MIESDRRLNGMLRNLKQSSQLLTGNRLCGLGSFHGKITEFSSRLFLTATTMARHTHTHTHMLMPVAAQSKA
jgi:hypothetical protein